MSDSGGHSTFRLLGPVELAVDGRAADLGPSKQRGLLAALLLTPGQPVPIGTLIDRLWADRPPRQARRVLASYVSRLRRSVEAAGTGVASFEYRAGGYAVDCRPDTVDLHRARRLARQARAVGKAGDLPQAADLFAAALAGWQAEPLAGVSGEWAARVRDGLQAEQLDLLAERIDADLGMGRYGEVVDELRGLVAQHPTAEQLVALLIRALVGAGRSVEALECYERLRVEVAETLGTEPSAPLRELHLQVLRDDPALAPAEVGTGPESAAPESADRESADAESPGSEPANSEPADPAPAGPGSGPAEFRPAQLPADVAGFTGRADQLGLLDACLPSDRSPDSTAVTVTVIAGTAGVGKTALAVHWAHRVRDRFADGQIYVNLHGYAAGPPVRPIEALAGILLAAGVAPEAIPADVEQAAALYRSTLTDRRVLVVLDDAADPEQVRPLLPGTPGCMVLVTSRNRLSGLTARDGARRLTVDVLSPAEARVLLMHTLGAQRVRDEAEPAAELAAACAFLPLALRIACARLADHPDRPIAEAVEELRGGDRLAALEADGDPQAAVRVAFSRSYTALPVPAQRMMRLVGLAPGPDVTVDAAGALAASAPAEAGQLLDRLAAAHLLTQPGPGRYSCHDLLRRFAAEQAYQEDGPARRADAVGRLLDWYLGSADAAARLMYPTMVRLPVVVTPAHRPAAFADPAEARSWLDAERANLLAAIRHAAEYGPGPAAWLLADTLRGYLWLTRRTVDWLEVAETALSAATAAGDLPAQAAARLSLGVADYCLGRTATAVDRLTESAELAERAAWPAGQVAAFNYLGMVSAEVGEPEQAAGYFTRAVALGDRVGSPHGDAALNNLGVVQMELGNVALAVECATRALPLVRRSGSPEGQAMTLLLLAEGARTQGRLRAGHDHATAALELLRATGIRHGEAAALHELAALQQETGRYAEGVRTAGEALTVARDTNDRRVEMDVHNLLGELTRHLGRPAAAGQHHRTALELARAGGAGYREVVALLGLAALDRDRGQHDHAVERALRALDMSRRTGYRLLEGRALLALADSDLAAGRHQPAAEHAALARAVYQAAGDPLGQARAEAILDRCQHR